VSRRGVSSECRDAARDVARVCREVGAEIEFRVREESGVGRDRYGSIVQRSSDRTFRMWAVIKRSPEDRERRGTGLFETADAVAWTPAIDWETYGHDFDGIDANRTSVVLGGRTFEIADRDRRGQCQDVWLWYVFSLRRR
jgi:hypothetical protein